MQSSQGMAPRTLAGAAFAVTLCSGCCGSVDATTWQGTLAYAFNDAPADAGADAGNGGGAPKPSAIGSMYVVVTLDAFAPWVDNGFDGSYCGASQFQVELGPQCELVATVNSADWSGKYASDTGSADIQGGQQCTLTTPQGTFTVAVQGGTVGVSGGVVDLVVDTQGANVEFQGNLQ
jgi:hypothetical protein